MMNEWCVLYMQNCSFEVLSGALVRYVSLMCGVSCTCRTAPLKSCQELCQVHVLNVWGVMHMQNCTFEVLSGVLSGVCP